MSSKNNKNTINVVIISLVAKALTLLSRTVYMAAFGDSNPFLNVYVYALDIPNVVFNCIGTALNTVVIPIYTSLLSQKENINAKKFLDDIISISISIITFLVIVGMAASPFIAARSFGDITNEYSAYCAFALRALLPVMIFYGFNYIFQGILQSHGQFKLPAFVSAPTGIIIILYMIFFSEKWGVTGLIAATALGLFAQPVIMVGAVRKTGYRYNFSFDIKSPHIKTAGALTLPVLASASSYQINFLFNNAMALRFGSAPLMTYSQQLVQTFMLTIVYAITGVYYPKLSSLWACGEKECYKGALQELIEYMLFLILPCAGGFFLLRYEIMDFLLNWKRDSATNIHMGGNLLGLYSAGIIAISFKDVLDKAFYSAKDSKTPAVFGFVIMGINIGVTILLLNFTDLGVYSMPVAYVFSAFFGAFGLFIKACRLVKIWEKDFFVSLLKIVLATVLMYFTAGLGLKYSADIYLINDILSKLTGLFITAAIGICVYFAAAYVLGISVFYNRFLPRATK